MICLEIYFRVMDRADAAIFLKIEARAEPKSKALLSHSGREF